MVGYRDVRYVLSIDGMRAEQDLPVGTMRLRCDHRGTVSDFNLQNLRPTSIRLVVPSCRSGRRTSSTRVSVMVSQRLDRELSWREYRVEFVPIRTDMSGEIQLWFVGAVVGIDLPLAHFAFEDEHLG
jgi:hypothetical protein